MWKDIKGRLDDQLHPYFNRREKLSTEENCLMWGIRAVIPSNEAAYLEVITSKSKSSRDSENKSLQHVWWPGIDEDV